MSDNDKFNRWEGKLKRQLHAAGLREFNPQKDNIGDRWIINVFHDEVAAEKLDRAKSIIDNFNQKHPQAEAALYGRHPSAYQSLTRAR